MTTPPEHPVVRQEEDRLPGRGVSAIIVATVLITIGLSLWAWQVWSSRTPTVPVARVAPREVGIIDQTLIDIDTTAYGLADRKHLLLRSAAWISPEGAIARIPIEQAMELIVERYR